MVEEAGNQKKQNTSRLLPIQLEIIDLNKHVLYLQVMIITNIFVSILCYFIYKLSLVLSFYIWLCGKNSHSLSDLVSFPFIVCHQLDAVHRDLSSKGIQIRSCLSRAVKKQGSMIWMKHFLHKKWANLQTQAKALLHIQMFILSLNNIHLSPKLISSKWNTGRCIFLKK